PACDAYLAGLERYLACDKVPEQARAAMRDSIDQLRQTWRGLSDASMPEEARRAASDACKQASDAIGQSASAMGCAP
ncbi:MAG: hypothetical protein K8W52_15270, partial [Deltaproteobacteria bacterium]|nr:hypothetical protein [Deltaproteobacteria bacterium]